MDELRFDGRVAVVTGAGRGIGRSHALLLASRGAKLVVADSGSELDGSGSSRRPAAEVAEEIEANGGEAVAYCASVAEEDGAASIVGTAIEHFGRLDVVVNNAGISDKHPFHELSFEQFRRMMDVHFFGTLYVTKAAWPYLVEAGDGRVVNTTSEGVLGAQTELTSYGSAKGAVWALTRNLAAEGSADGIRVNAVAPRARTRMSEDGQRVAAGAAREPRAESVLDRMDPELVAPAAAYLAHESCMLNGEVLIAGGGDVMRLAPIVTRGIARGKELSVEDIAESIDAILDGTDARRARRELVNTGLEIRRNGVATNRLDGKVAIVTGAGTTPPGVGIGCAIAQVLAGAGASVLLVDKDAEHGEVTRGMIEESGGRSAVCVADVSVETDCEAMVRAAGDTFGGLDILVNNAGISKHVTVTDTPQELFEEIIGVNLRGPFMACKYAIPELMARGGGSIVNIGSVVAIRDAGTSHPAYAASKGGVLGITIDLAGAYGRDNIRVNAVLPGMIASPIQASIGSASPEMQKRMNMLGRMGNVWDIAHAVGFLCTDEASYITGHVMPVDGGATAAMPSSASRPDRPDDR